MQKLFHYKEWLDNQQHNTTSMSTLIAKLPDANYRLNRQRSIPCAPKSVDAKTMVIICSSMAFCPSLWLILTETTITNFPTFQLLITRTLITCFSISSIYPWSVFFLLPREVSPKENKHCIGNIFFYWQPKVKSRHMLINMRWYDNKWKVFLALKAVCAKNFSKITTIAIKARIIRR